MKILYSVLLLALFALSLDAIQIAISGNVTTSEVRNLDEFQYRRSLIIPWIGSATYFSASVDVQQSGQNTNIDADAILGVVTYAGLPASTFAYFDGTANIDVDSAANSGSGNANIDTQATAGYLLTGFVRLEERDAAGNVVARLPFKDYRWDVDTEGTGSRNGIHYLTVKAATSGTLFKTNAPADIYISWLIADTYGKVTVDGVETFVFPKALESFLKVENYNYQAAGNNLVLILGSCSGSVSRTSSRVVGWNNIEADVVSAGDDLRIVYSTNAVVDGSDRKVTVEKTFEISASDALDGELATFTSELSAAWDGSSECHKTEVAFPADADLIKYDPGLSQGPLPSSAVSILFSLALIVLAAMI